MSCLSVLRFGPFPDDNDCAQRLRSALLDHFNKKQQLHKKSSAEHEERQISISNRYFTAQVLLGQIDDDQETDRKNSAAPLAEDGVVLVFDSLLSNPTLPTSMTASFDAMEVVHDRAVAAETAGDLLRLCVGVGDTSKPQGLSEKEYEAEYSRRVLWCLDRGYEYVEADLSEAGLTTGHDARDKEGFARIVEAISGTVWSSAVMEHRKHSEPKQEPNSEAASDTTLREKPESNTYQPPDPTKLPPVLGSEIKDKGREKMARQALLADTEEDTAMASKYLDDPGQKTDAETIKSRKEELEQEKALDTLEGTLREAKLLRELSQSGALSDDERRKRAGDAAMLLMNMMGKVGCSDDELSDDEESDNSLVDKEEKTG